MKQVKKEANSPNVIGNMAGGSQQQHQQQRTLASESPAMFQNSSRQNDNFGSPAPNIKREANDSPFVNQQGGYSQSYNNQGAGLQYGSPGYLHSGNQPYREELMRNPHANISQFPSFSQDPAAFNSIKSNPSNLTPSLVQENQTGLDQKMYLRATGAQGQFLSDLPVKKEYFGNNPFIAKPLDSEPRIELQSPRMPPATLLDNYNFHRLPYNTVFAPSNELTDLQKFSIKSAQAIPQASLSGGMGPKFPSQGKAMPSFADMKTFDYVERARQEVALGARANFLANSGQFPTKSFEDSMHDRHPDIF